MSDSVPIPPLNPYQPSTYGPEAVAAEFVPAASPPKGRPRVWTVFVTIIVAFVAMIAISIVGTGIIAVAMLANGSSPQELQTKLIEFLTSPPVFIGIGLPTQMTLAAAALAAAWLSPQPLAQRLGFVRPKWSWWETLVVNVGTLVPFAIGMAGAVWLAEFLAPDPTAANLMKNMTPAWIVPYLLFISLAPGFSEEMLFRGYSQRRLIERWGGWTAILVTSAIFAIIHIAPHTVVFAFPIGIWLGLMAWKSDCGTPTTSRSNTTSFPTSRRGSSSARSARWACWRLAGRWRSWRESRPRCRRYRREKTARPTLAKPSRKKYPRQDSNL